MLRAQFDNADENLFPSQFVNVVMQLDTLKDVGDVPAAAVQRGAPGTYVYLVNDDNTVSVHQITLGAQDGDLFAVDAGLEPGERVVTDGADGCGTVRSVSIPETEPRAHRRRAGGTAAAGAKAAGRGGREGRRLDHAAAAPPARSGGFAATAGQQQAQPPP